MAATVAMAAITFLVIFLLGSVLPCRFFALVFSRAGFLAGGVVAVVGMCVPASAVGAAAWLLLAAG